MPQFVIFGSHTPDGCPYSNEEVGPRAQLLLDLLPGVAETMEIGISSGPLHLEGHHILAIVEAARIETVEQLVNQTDLSEWNTVEVWPVNSLLDP